MQPASVTGIIILEQCGVEAETYRSLIFGKEDQESGITTLKSTTPIPGLDRSLRKTRGSSQVLVPFSLLSTFYSLLSTLYSLLSTPYSLLPTSYSLLLFYLNIFIGCSR